MTTSNGTAPGAERGHWQSRLGFVLAAAGSAVGLGNIWKFPYITGENGGGLFVIIYLICIAVVGLPVMIAEILIGRASQRSPVPAYEALSGGKLMWGLVGWLGVLTGFVILSYYSVVAGWAFDYVTVALGNGFGGKSPEQLEAMFNDLFGDFGRNVLWHALFMIITVGVVLGGVQKGIERGARILMPALLVMMIGLVLYATTLDGFGEGVDFIFAPHSDKLSPAGVLEALGHSFFTLSLGMGALITYGSYLHRDDDIFKASAWITALDTFVALMACLIMFPIVFSAGLGAGAGPGLVFQSMPVAFTQIPGGAFLGAVFFILLLFAALTSAMSLLEVVVATVIDKFRVSRTAATLAVGAVIFAFGIPSGKSDLMLGDKSFFGWMDYLTSNIALPLGGLAISLFVGWAVPESVAYEHFNTGTTRDTLYRGWRILLRYVAPVAILLILLYSLKILPTDWLR